MESIWLHLTRVLELYCYCLIEAYAYDAETALKNPKTLVVSIALACLDGCQGATTIEAPALGDLPFRGEGARIAQQAIMVFYAVSNGGHPRQV